MRCRRRTPSILALLALAGLLPGIAHGQRSTGNLELVTTDAIPRDRSTGQFVADLKAGEFEVYEDNVRQDLASVELVHDAGRIFVIVIDDLHVQFDQTPRLRTILKDVLRTVIHGGDMFAVISNGTSSISQPLTFDRQILETIANSKATGNGLVPSEIIASLNGADRGSNLRRRADVAFTTAYDLINNLQQIRNRRKAVLYISSGYHFDLTTMPDSDVDPFVGRQRNATASSDAELIREAVELTLSANRGSVTIYPIDPRGFINGPDLVLNVSQQDWIDYRQRAADTLRLLAARTGGYASFNQSDWTTALSRMDAETSDYYVLGYYANNPDPSRRVRQIEIRTTRSNVDVNYRSSYSMRQVPVPASR